MSGAPSEELFDAQYYASGCGRKYERDEQWLAFFGRIAGRIIADIDPQTVLDAGCAIGLLVESLRTRGVAAFGRDVSSFAISSVHESIRPYCELGSIADPVLRRYDLIVSIEVLEHMQGEEARAAIANLCRSTDDILFSSTPFDYREVTHFNVQPPEYWAELFAQQGFFRDVDYDASYITEWAVRFRRRTDPAHRIIRDYERGFWILRKENLDLRNLALDMRREAESSSSAPNSAAGSAAEGMADELQKQLAQRESELEELRTRWRKLEGSPGYAMMRWLQRFRARVAPPGSARERFIESIFAHSASHRSNSGA